MGIRSFGVGYALYFKNLWIAGLAFVSSLGRPLKKADILLWTILGGHPKVTISWAVGDQLLGKPRVQERERQAHARPLGKVFGPIVDLVALLWDKPAHALRTRLRKKGPPPKGAGFKYCILSLLLLFLLWNC